MTIRKPAPESMAPAPASPRPRGVEGLASAPVLSQVSLTGRGHGGRDGGGNEKSRLAAAESTRYKALHFLGSGGMGRVTAVHDERLDRDIAHKVPNPEVPASADLDARLAREAWITARLDHPGVVPIFDAGLGPDGRIYYTMPIVRGRSLAEVLAGTPTRGERMRLLRRWLEAAEAVAFAHRQGIVHNDLKPANIMLGDGGGTRVLDWGLAQVLGEDRPPGLAGTPQYMSPELVRGGAADQRSDTWSLGAILHEIVLGRPVRARGSASDVLAQARDEATSTQPYLSLDADTPAELVAILARALEPSPERRYADAGALAEDVARYLEGRRVTAHVYSMGELLVRFVRAWRLPLLVAFAGLVAVFVVVVVGMDRLQAEAERATAAAAHAETSERRASRDLSLALESQALLSSSVMARTEAELFAAHALLEQESPIARGVLAAFGVTKPTALVWRSPLPDCVRVALDETGTRVLCREETGMSAWRISRRGARPELLWRREIEARDFAFGATTVAVLVNAQDLVLLDARTGATRERYAIGCGLEIRRAEAPVVAVSTGCVWSTATLMSGLRTPCRGHGLMGAMAVTHDGEGWAALCEDGVLVRGMFVESEGAWTTVSTGLAGVALALAAEFVNDEQLVVGTGDGDLVLLDATRGTIRERMPTGFNKVVALTVSPDSGLAAVLASSGAVTVFEPQLGLMRDRLPDMRTRAAAIVGDTIITLSHEARAYEFSGGPPSIFGIGSGVTSLAFDPTGVEVAATSGYRLVVREVTSARQRADETFDGEFIKYGAYAADGRSFHIVTSSVPVGADRRPIHSWETDTWQRTAKMSTRDGFRRVVPTRDPQTLLALPYRGGVTTLRPGDEASWVGLVPESVAYWDLSASPDGGYAVAMSDDGDLVRIATTTWTVEGFGSDVRARAAAIARDGVLVVSAGEGRVTLWDAERGEVTGLIEAPGVAFMDVAISPEMRWVAAGSRDGAAWLWDIGSLRLVAKMPVHDERVSNVAFSPDGRLLATGSWDGFVRLFALDRLEVPGAELAETAVRTWGRTLTEVLRRE